MKGIKYLGLLVLICSGCSSNNLSPSSSGIKESTKSNSLLSSIITSSSTSNDIEMEDIKIKVLNDFITPNDEINYSVEIMPLNATNQLYKLSTSTPDIILIDNLKVYAKKIGVGTLTVSSLDNEHSDTVNVNVKKKEPYNDIYSKLETSLSFEEFSLSNVSSLYSYASEVYEEKEQLEWHIFDSSIQRNKIKDNQITDIQLNYIEDNNLNIFSVLNNNSEVRLEKVLIGDTTNSITSIEANKRVSLVNYDDIYGASNYIKHILNDELTFNSDEMVNYIKVDTEDNLKYQIEGECYFLNSHLDNVDSLMKAFAQVNFNDNYSLKSFEYRVEKYTPTENDYIDLVNPTSIEEFNMQFTYDNKDESKKINVNNYKVSSFEIDESNLKNEDGENVLEIGESIKLNLIETPSVHLEENYILEIEDTSIIKDLGNLTIKGLKVGTTKIKVISSSNLTREIDVKVLAPKVDRIYLGYIPFFVEVGDSFEVKATCYPFDAENRNYTISLKEGDESKASLEDLGSGIYKFNALAAGDVTIIATSSENEEIYDETVVTIKEKPNLDDMKNTLCSKVYKHTSSSDTSELDLNNDGTGTLKLEGGGEYSFNWDLEEDLYFKFTNIVTTKSPDKWYDFKGQNGSNTDRNCTMINLIIYDLDYESAVSLQFS